MTYIPQRDLRAITLYDPVLLEDLPEINRWKDPRQWGLGIAISMGFCAFMAAPILCLVVGYGIWSMFRKQQPIIIQ